MNKKCTNPSCRRTFSTLDFYGHCPYCDKVYPQLVPQRNEVYRHFRYQRKVSVLSDRSSLKIMLIKIGFFNIGLDEVKKEIANGMIVKAVKALRKEFERNGYSASLKGCVLFARALQKGCEPCVVWRATGELSEPGKLKRIEPIEW